MSVYTDLTNDERPDTTKLPAVVRAEMLAGETSMFFNVALFEHGQRIADMFAKSTMVPEHFRGNIGNCMIALNYASRVKADPFMAMQTMYVVHGKPGVEGKLVAALINQSGKYRDPIEYEWLDETDQNVKKHLVTNNPTKDNRGCMAVTVDARSGKRVEGPKITWRIVHEEGWYNKSGSKWKTMPELMFMYRAASWFSNVHCPEVKLGMQTVEELKDIVDLGRSPDGSYSTGTTQDLSKAIISNVQDEPEPPLAIRAGQILYDTQEKEPEPETTQPPRFHPWDRNQWVNMRRGNKTTTGYAVYVLKNLDTFDEAPPAIKAEAKEKWDALYPDDRWPGEQDPEPEQDDPPAEDPQAAEDQEWPTREQVTAEAEAEAKQRAEELEQRVSGNGDQDDIEMSQTELIEGIRNFDLEARREAHRRVEIPMGAVLGVYSYEIVKELYDMCFVVRDELRM